MYNATSYSHCPKCGQLTIDGQFTCGHSPVQEPLKHVDNSLHEPHMGCTGPCCMPELYKNGTKGGGYLSTEPIVLSAVLLTGDKAALHQALLKVHSIIEYLKTSIFFTDSDTSVILAYVDALAILEDTRKRLESLLFDSTGLRQKYVHSISKEAL